MTYNTWLRPLATVFISILVCTQYTNSLAGGTATPPSGQLPLTLVNTVFLPLVQNDPVISRKAEDPAFVDRALVERVALVKLDVAPIQINAIVSGNLPSACLAINKVQQAYSAQQIRLTLFTHLRLDRQLCATVLTPFAETVPLHLNGLAAGDYAVVVQAQQADFTLTAEEAIANQFYLPLVTH